MKALLIPALLLCVIAAGCTTAVPVPGSPQPLALSQQAHFENNGYAFGASITHIDRKDNGTILVTMTIENTGKQGMTLSAMPSLKDPAGQTYVGQTIFFSQIAPGHSSTQKGAIAITGGNVNQIGQGSVLMVRFQGTSPIPYETAWSVDLTRLPE